MKNLKLISVLILLLLIFGAFFYLKREKINAEPLNLGSLDKTDFVAEGNLVYNNPGLKPNTPFLIYEKPGQPALQKELVLDENSTCAFQNGAIICLAMSVSPEITFSGKRAIVEGIEQGDTVLVRKIRILEKEENVTLPAPGEIYVAWPVVVNLLRSCQVESVMQAHSLDVYITTKEGQKLHTVEPVIDEVFKIINLPDNKCAKIPVAIE